MQCEKGFVVRLAFSAFVMSEMEVATTTSLPTMQIGRLFFVENAPLIYFLEHSVVRVPCWLAWEARIEERGSSGRGG